MKLCIDYNSLALIICIWLYQVFNSVPTSDTDLERLHAVIHDNVELDNTANCYIIQRCIDLLI